MAPFTVDELVFFVPRSGEGPDGICIGKVISCTDEEVKIKRLVSSMDPEYSCHRSSVWSLTDQDDVPNQFRDMELIDDTQAYEGIGLFEELSLCGGNKGGPQQQATSTTIPLQGMSMGNIISQVAGRSLTSCIAADDAVNIPYDGLLDRAPAMPTVGSEKHDSVYIALMVKYFYEYMRLIGSFTPEQNKIVDDLAGDYDEQTFQKYLQITGKDISNP